MIDKKISVSEQVANLPIEAQLIFTWAIPHADDIGLLPFSHRTLKALIVPMMDISLETFGFHIEKILEQGLIEEWEYEGEKYYRIIKFLENQTLKKDRKPNCLAKNIDSWAKVEKIGFHVEDDGNPSKDKGSKVKIFIKPTIEEIKSYCLERKNKVNPQKFFNYYESNGWKVGKNPMKNWKAAVHTWENSDYTKNNSPSPPSQISDAARAHAKRIKDEEEQREREENAKHNEKIREVKELTEGLSNRMKI